MQDWIRIAKAHNLRTLSRCLVTFRSTVYYSNNRCYCICACMHELLFNQSLCALTIELYRIHTPCALCICIQTMKMIQLYLLTVSTSFCVHEQKSHDLQWARSMGMDECQNKNAVCDAHRPFQSIWSILKRVFRQFRLICYAYKLLRCLKVEIWRFSWWQTTDRQNRLLYLLHMCTG